MILKSNIVLEGIDISKNYGGVKALQNVSFELKSGEILSVIGENGAGKSTLMKIIAGAVSKTSGKLIFEGEEIYLKTPLDAVELGISIVYQEPNIFPDMSVLENIFMGNEVLSKGGTIKWHEMNSQAKTALAAVGLTNGILHLPMSDLSIGNQQLVLIARGIFKKCKVLILDEPTSILSHAESEKLFEIIFSLKKSGVSILYISHRIPEILRISDHIIVLRDGLLTSELTPSEANEESIITAMSGRKIKTDTYEEREFGELENILEVENLGYSNIYRNISFTIKPGEILGMYGLVGSGRSEIARTIFGETKSTEGFYKFEGEIIKKTSIREMIRRKVFYLPEDRGSQGLFSFHSVNNNMSVSFIDKYANKLKLIDEKREQKEVRSNIEYYNIKTSSLDIPVSSLSGGSQQKVLFCRWLLEKPKVLILDEPTRGIDIMTKIEIHKFIIELAKKGVAILLISSDLPEVMELSDRMLVMHKGEMIKHLLRTEFNENTILKYALNLERDKMQNGIKRVN